MARDERRFSSISGIDERVRRTTTSSGVRVVTDSVPEAHSVSLSAWIGAGSRDEPQDLAGACHFLEHLLFKGTTRRGSHQINTAVDSVGGEFNAYTARVHRAAQRDAVVYRQFAQVMNLLAPPESLMAPRILWRALLFGGRRAAQPAPALVPAVQPSAGD